MNKPKVTKYFNENSKAWISSSYEGDGYDYPTARLRSEKTIEIISQLFPKGNAKILDLGCGAGHMAIKLVEKGFRVTGIDNSDSMLSIANEASAKIKQEYLGKVEFVQSDIIDNKVTKSSYDVISALGVIGYLPDDASIFREAHRILKSGGSFIVSCRNRLFNMVSISDHTLREIEFGTAKPLIEEIQSLYQQVPDVDSANFISLLSELSNSLTFGTKPDLGIRKQNTTPEVTMSIDARQHTPKELCASAEEHGFKHQAYYGINPHLLMARLNNLMPPNFYHTISSSLSALDHLPVALIWSSEFIGVFTKK